MRDIYEHKIAYKPDDEKAHAQYANWLTENNDPRGEFIQLQLALEDETKPAEVRSELRMRERELLNEHRRKWLGELAPQLLDNRPTIEGDDRPGLIQVRRGWPDKLGGRPLAGELGRAAGSSPPGRQLGGAGGR